MVSESLKLFVAVATRGRNFVALFQPNKRASRTCSFVYVPLELSRSDSKKQVDLMQIVEYVEYNKA